MGLSAVGACGRCKPFCSVPADTVTSTAYAAYDRRVAGNLNDRKVGAWATENPQVNTLELHRRVRPGGSIDVRDDLCIERKLNIS